MLTDVPLDFIYENDYHFHIDMVIKDTYRTKQREYIVKFLKSKADEHFSADELFYALASDLKTADHTDTCKKTPALATVYRTLDKLVKDGTLRKFTSEAGEKACYQYISEKSNCAKHYHLKCTQCGSLIHLSCSQIQKLASHIQKNHQFTLATSRTVLYGLCAQCSRTTHTTGEK